MTSKPASKKRRRKKIKVHYDRLIVQLLLLAVIVFGVVWIISKCNRQSFERDADPTAVEAGRLDAERAVNAPAGSMERDNLLLFIRSREYELRSNGHAHAADDYIEAARTYLIEHGIDE